MKVKRIFIGILCFLFWSCKNTTPVFQTDIRIADLNLKFGITSLKEVRDRFLLQKCSPDDDVEAEAITCYYIQKVLYFSKINKIHIAFIFKDTVLIRIFCASELNPKSEITKREITNYLTHQYGLKTTNLKQLIEKNALKHTTFTENFRLTQSHFYYTAELNDSQYEKFNLKKVEID